METFSKDKRGTFKYWFAHWCAFNMVAILCGRWRFKYLFHDAEKPWLLLILGDYQKVRKWHKTHNRHHLEWLDRKVGQHNNDWDTRKYIRKYGEKVDWEGMVIDWECSRFTKTASPLNAYDEMYVVLENEHVRTHYPYLWGYSHLIRSYWLVPAMKRLGLFNPQTKTENDQS